MHEYMRRIDKAIAGGLVFAPDSVSHAIVAHDKGCKIYSGKECNCDPDITITDAGEVVHIYKDGTFVRKAMS